MRKLKCCWAVYPILSANKLVENRLSSISCILSFPLQCSRSIITIHYSLKLFIRVVCRGLLRHICHVRSNKANVEETTSSKIGLLPWEFETYNELGNSVMNLFIRYFDRFKQWSFPRQKSIFLKTRCLMGPYKTFRYMRNNFSCQFMLVMHYRF